MAFSLVCACASVLFFRLDVHYFCTRLDMALSWSEVTWFIENPNHHSEQPLGRSWKNSTNHYACIVH